MTETITLPRAVIKRMRSELYFLVCFADTDCGDSDCEECEPLRPIRAAIAVFDAALAAPEPEPTVKESLTVDAALAEPESDAQCPTCGGGGLVPDPTWDWVRCDVCNPLPEKPEPPVKESLTTNHIRSIWLDSWKACGNVPTPVLAEHFARQIERALAALAEPPAKPEPVAWMYVNLEGECEQIEYGTPSIDDDSITLLYAAPPKPPAKREPATVEQIDEEYIRPVIDARWHDFEAGFRAAERFHGIGGSKT